MSSEVPEQVTEQQQVEGATEAKQSRAEKKARKMFASLNLKPVAGVSRVCFRKSKNILFIIDKPDVYQSTNDSYVIFGEARIEDLSQYGQRLAAERIKPTVLDCAPSTSTDDATKNSEVEEEEVAVDEEGMEEKDIELVMSQANVTRGKAVKALKDNGNDIVNAIMELTA
ncbi:hypothetical protein QR680_004361 [Steinernema hermaphroditum]|uniref:NAC-A/B domain-containing protein n=1 Tax=Steinernema hermaphroditum TaxID=289476 RepID=A0AA39HQP3_9BILA|nr:hypothetical protein QR680_004361 [Steinernema hermaphroditum]